MFRHNPAKNILPKMPCYFLRRLIPENMQRLRGETKAQPLALFNAVIGRPSSPENIDALY
jgi:hypothetical protein